MQVRSAGIKTGDKPKQRELSPEKKEKSDFSDETVIFEIASPEEVFDNSWKSISSLEKNQKEIIDQLILKFNEKNLRDTRSFQE